LWLDNSNEVRLLAASRSTSAKAEDHWTLRERFEQGEIDVDPDDDKLAPQLGSIKWGIDSRGRFKIESDDDMRKRGLLLPDWADTAAMIFSGRANAAVMNVESHADESITGDLMTKAWWQFDQFDATLLSRGHSPRTHRTGWGRH
jgi:hypothetical protein